jgi:hypothetical protein
LLVARHPWSDGTGAGDQSGFFVVRYAVDETVLQRDYSFEARHSSLPLQVSKKSQQCLPWHGHRLLFHQTQSSTLQAQKRLPKVAVVVIPSLFDQLKKSQRTFGSRRTLESGSLTRRGLLRLDGDAGNQRALKSLGTVVVLERVVVVEQQFPMLSERVVGE